MTEQRDVSRSTRALAVVCRVCPACLVVRRRPRSAFAKAFAKIQRACPFCRAYDKVRNIQVKADQTPEKPVAIRFV